MDPEAVELAHRIFDLARAGSVDELVAYVDAGVPVDLTDAAGNTVLMLAAYHGHVSLVGALAARGAAVDRMNDRGQTPLAGAAFKGELGVLEVLLSAGADPTLGTPSALETARFFGKQELVARLARLRT